MLNSQFGAQIAEKFVENGLQFLMRDLGTSNFKDLVLITTCDLIQQEPSICVPLLKLNLISNLLLSTLQTDPQLEQLIQDFIKLAVESEYRTTLLKKSQDFKPEKSRLEKISKDKSVKMAE